MLIDVYADLVCPWCWIGKRRLDRALAQRPDYSVERRWHPFQLQPEMPAGGLPWADFARDKFGGLARANAAFAQVTAAGAADNITFAFDRIAKAPNTRDAHRLVLFSAGYECQADMAEALFQAYFRDGRDIGDREALLALAASVGLPEDAARRHLQGSEGLAEVDASQHEAHALGITGVPFYIFDGRFAISGAQPLDVFMRALDLAHDQRPTELPVDTTG